MPYSVNTRFFLEERAFLRMYVKQISLTHWQEIFLIVQRISLQYMTMKRTITISTAAAMVQMMIIFVFQWCTSFLYTTDTSESLSSEAERQMGDIISDSDNNAEEIFLKCYEKE